jgi:hypothetical protein
VQAIATAIGFVLGKIVAALGWIGQLAVKAFEAVWWVVTDLVCWAFDGFMGIASTTLAGFDFSGLSTWSSSWSSLPGNVLEVLSAVGVAPAMGIIVSAITIRLLLQLIPFTRLGS